MQDIMDMIKQTVLSPYSRLIFVGNTKFYLRVFKNLDNFSGLRHKIDGNIKNIKTEIKQKTFIVFI